jgi:DNA-binding transcriptional ArsR family regulator
VTGSLVPSSAVEERQRSAVIARALADPIRLCVLEALAAHGECSVSDLSRNAGCQIPNMSQHLGVLRSVGLVASRRAGTTVYYRLADPRVLEAYQLLRDIAAPSEKGTRSING